MQNEIMSRNGYGEAVVQFPENEDLNGNKVKAGPAHRGFAAMNPNQQKQIASKGGETVSRNREHMAEIGKKGGEIVSQNRRHMSEIGRKGGEASRISRSQQ